MELLLERRRVWPEFERLIAEAQGRPLRGRRAFYEEEIVIPSGRYKGQKFRVNYQPFFGLWLDTVDRGPWRRRNVTGCVQSGKSLMGFVGPICYHAFELGQRVAVGVPDLDMVKDKWNIDLGPVIELMRYREYMPSGGASSRGGTPMTTLLKNGGVIRFMTGGGGDKSRAGFAADVTVITERDGMDEQASTSDETNKVRQIQARAKAAGEMAEHYTECTLTTEQGGTWRDHVAGTRSRIIVRCGACAGWTTPEREHLAGWKGAEHVIAARDGARWACPNCGVIWTEAERREMNLGARLIHAGQEVDERGRIVGEVKQTDIFSMRWNAFNNMFWAASTVAEDEWKAAQSARPEDEEKYLCQYVWANPYVPPAQEIDLLDARTLEQRKNQWSMGLFPERTVSAAMGIDVGKWQCHWALTAETEDGFYGEVEYGDVGVQSGMMDEDEALYAALMELTERVEDGWQWEGHAARRMPELVYIDSGYRPAVVYRVCRERGDRFRPTKGHSMLQKIGYEKPYRAPRKEAKEILFIGEGLHFVADEKNEVLLVHVNADHWKGEVHRRLALPMESVGSLTLYEATDKKAHLAIVKSFLSERKEKKWVEGKGEQEVWVVKQRGKNHLLDATALALAGLSTIKGLREEAGRKKEGGGKREERRATLRGEDGRAWLVTERGEG